MEGEWTEYEYIDEDDLAQPDFYVDQFYPTGGLQVSTFHGPLKDQGPLTLGSIYVYNLHTHKSLRMTWRMTWAVVLLLSQSVRSWSTALSQRSLTVSSTWARLLSGASSSELSHRLLRYI